MTEEPLGPSPAGVMPVELMLRVSERLRAFVEFVGRWGAVFILPLVFVTMWDVFLRKVGGMQVWLVEHLGRSFESTVIQEFEWHFHTALFTLVLGYGLVRNRHVRVDLIREKLSFRKQAWIEFLGLTLFMIPYCLIVGYFASAFAWDSFMVGEKSASTVGLSYRWIIKTVLVFGLFTAFLAGVAVWLQTVVVLFGPKDLRFKLMTLEWPEAARARGGRLSAGPGV
jgi:TRAP-type mannitol/chloroaromatic compound transport system permease small subunit